MTRRNWDEWSSTWDNFFRTFKTMSEAENEPFSVQVDLARKKVIVIIGEDTLRPKFTAELTLSAADSMAIELARAVKAIQQAS